MEHSQELAARIRDRIRELDAQIEAHQRALAALDGQQADTQAASNDGQRDAISTEAVFDAVAHGDDQAAVIAHEFGVSTSLVRQRLQQLEQAGRVSRTGRRRSTRWHSRTPS